MGQESKGLKVRPATVADAGALAASIRGPAAFAGSTGPML